MNEGRDVKRTWPFESLGEPEEPFHAPADFVRRRGPDVAAIVVRIGLHDAQLVLVDDDGRWERWVYATVDEARRAAEALGLTPHLGEYPEEARVKLNACIRPPEDLYRGAYPEQGRVGPVISYPENRPRLPEVEEETTPPGDERS
jgi:hypothetical protein